MTFSDGPILNCVQAAESMSDCSCDMAIEALLCVALYNSVVDSAI